MWFYFIVLGKGDDFEAVTTVINGDDEILA
jgi:hypothetical protein